MHKEFEQLELKFNAKISALESILNERVASAECTIENLSNRILALENDIINKEN